MSCLSIALAGNPNCGKTTVFNLLTGSRQKVGNWAGVTVEKKVGQLRLGQHHVDVIDLPGVYSMCQDDLGVDEKIARSYIHNEKPDFIVNVVDASNLNRNLLLTHELLETGCPVIIVLNMLDVAAKHGVNIDIEALEASLGVPIIPIVASKGTGIKRLKQSLLEMAEQGYVTPTLQEELLCKGNEINERFRWVQEKTKNAITIDPSTRTTTDRIDAIVLNRWLGIPIFLLMMYLMFMLAINLGAVFIDFFDILFGTFLVDGVGYVLAEFNTPAWLITILADGVGGGIQLVSTFIPVIGFLYLCLGVLEDSGYMSRAAFVVDRLMARIGLPGNSFVPLIVGFGCNVPSVMATRSLSRDQDRLLTIAMAPFMSCGARLTVYALFTAAFFPENGSLIVFALYLIGIFIAVLTGWIFRKTLFSGEPSTSFQEMPAYHAPTLRNIVTTTWHRLSGFVKRAGSTIIKVVTLLTIINSIGLDGSFGNQNSQNSLLSTVGKAVTPILSPIGVEEENWPATVGVFTGIFAKEAVVGTLDVLYQDVAGVAKSTDEALNVVTRIKEAFTSIGDNIQGLLENLGDPLGMAAVTDTAEQQGVSNTGLKAMKDLFGNGYSAFCYLILILLYTPCVAMMGAMNRESGPLWAGLVIAWSSFIAYWLASVMYQLGNIMQNPVFALSWLLGSAVTMLLAIHGLKLLGSRSKKLPSNIIARV